MALKQECVITSLIFKVLEKREYINLGIVFLKMSICKFMLHLFSHC